MPAGPLRRYILAVTLGGVAASAIVTIGADRPALAHDHRIWILALFAVLGELVPLRVPFRGGVQDVTVSTTFVFALLLVGGAEAALVAQVAGSILSDVIDRKPWWKAGFNATQYALVITAAAAVHQLLGGTVGARPDAAMVPPIVAAGFTFYVLNNLLVGRAVTLAQGASLSSFLSSDLFFQVATTMVLLSQAPLVVFVTENALWLLPAFLPAIAAAYRSAQVSLQRDREALYDALTGLPNRNHFQQALARAANGDGHSFAVALFDIERFRDVNTTLGHELGDRLLTGVGRRLRAHIPEHWLLARLGADEFGVLASTRNDDEAVSVAQAIHDAFASPLMLDALPFKVEASVGVASAPDDGQRPELLMRRAEIALAVARERTSGIERYNAALDRSDPRRLALLSELHGAIDTGELVLHFQPEVDLHDDTIRTVEALVRWEHPVRGLLPPDEFVPLAETTGLMGRLTQRVLGEAIAQCRRFRDDGLRLTVSVNVSARNLDESTLSDTIERLLWEHALPADALEIEITESAAVADVQRAREVLGHIHDLGVRVALDDFGTGQSALAYLKALPIDKLKIDKTFVQAMASNPSDATIVRSTIELGHNLGLQVAAEGVETLATLTELSSYGCDVVQGFALSRPLPADRLASFLRAWHGGTVPDATGRLLRLRTAG